MNTNNKVAVLGGGSFGTVLANIAASNGFNVSLWVRDADQALRINSEGANTDYHPELKLSDKIEASDDLNKVIEDFSNHEEIIIIGGSEIYKLALPLVKKLYITYVDGSYSGDTWFPKFNLNQWSLESSEDLECPKSNITYASKIYFRVNE